MHTLVYVFFVDHDVRGLVMTDMPQRASRCRGAIGLYVIIKQCTFYLYASSGSFARSPQYGARRLKSICR